MIMRGKERKWKGREGRARKERGRKGRGIQDKGVKALVTFIHFKTLCWPIGCGLFLGFLLDQAHHHPM